MIIVSQDGSKITDSLEFEIREVMTCRNIPIPKEQLEKFKKITQKKSDYMSYKDLKGLEEFLGQEITKSVYLIRHIKTNKTFGVYDTKEKAKSVLKAIIQKIEKQKSYSFPEDKAIGISLL